VERDTTNYYEAFGGEPFFADLVSQFYAHVATNEILRPMYPESDMKGAAHRLQIFLEQYWGGPQTYSELRGHPRLRMRHNAFPITPKAKDAWLKHMRVALESLELSPLNEATLWDYLQSAAISMVNKMEL
jgi:hemoglobin